VSLRIGVVTGTRAEYGLLRPLLRVLDSDDRFELRLVATGAHLSPEFGSTVEQIEDDGFVVAERVEMLLSSDSPVGITTSLGVATTGFGVALDRLRPDVVLVLGDRYELLAVAEAALIARIPLVHLSGGDVTEGAIDDAIRHAITKMAHLHMAFNAEAAGRIRQMGEDPSRVHVTGNPGLDDLVATPAGSREELATELGFELRDRNLLVTYHPVTLADEPPVPSFRELLDALADLGDDVGLVLTLPNADTHGRALIDMTRSFVEGRDNAVAHTSLGAERYYRTLRTVDAVVGNSSSGIIEAPAVATPTVNVGVRQRGRLRGASTIDCPPRRHAISAAIGQVLSWTDVPTSSPYGDGHATARIVATLAAIDDPRALLHKRFHTTPSEHP
jgi:UDP-hydrolysing UDP-N-acetyl-D-glucosamine 2-epimerase